MYNLIALVNDGIVKCGCHRSLKDCEETAVQMYEFMHESMNIIHTTFIAEKDNECVYVWIY